LSCRRRAGIGRRTRRRAWLLVPRRRNRRKEITPQKQNCG
jgi:hypothetical protein